MTCAAPAFECHMLGAASPSPPSANNARNSHDCVFTSTLRFEVPEAQNSAIVKVGSVDSLLNPRSSVSIPNGGVCTCTNKDFFVDYSSNQLITTMPMDFETRSLIDTDIRCRYEWRGQTLVATSRAKVIVKDVNEAPVIEYTDDDVPPPLVVGGTLKLNARDEDAGDEVSFKIIGESCGASISKTGLLTSDPKRWKPSCVGILVEAYDKHALGVKRYVTFKSPS